MPSVQTFEELEFWKDARHLANVIYAVSNAGCFARDFGLRDQMRRAAVSIVSNIAEGFERGGDREFSQFLSIAKGSSGELRAQLFIALDQQYITQAQFDECRLLAIQISKRIARFMQYLKSSSLQGPKYKPATPE